MKGFVHLPINEITLLKCNSNCFTILHCKHYKTQVIFLQREWCANAAAHVLVDALLVRIRSAITTYLVLPVTHGKYMHVK